MNLDSMNKSYLLYWNQLEKLAIDLDIKNLRQFFSEDPNRSKTFSFEVGDLLVDFSKNWIDSNSISLLIKLAQSCDLDKKITSLLNGEIVNFTENRAATHAVQRREKTTQSVLNEREKMFTVAQNYNSGEWKTAFGKKVSTVVNIGIGGSYLGPKLAIEALTDLQLNNEIKTYFFATIDDCDLAQMIQQIDLESTLFCVSSKSLGTSETLLNTETIIDLLKSQKSYNPTTKNSSFVAATANFEKAAQLGISNSHVLPFADSIGGRFSVWSSIGFPLLMAIGKQPFLSFLKGAEQVDQHFGSTPFEKNVPVLLALVSIWYRNFIGLSSYAVIPYDMRLRSFADWLQQLMMESNGKACDIDGQDFQHLTSPCVFGGHGQLSQHAFFQAFHQGNDISPIDFIGVKKSESKAQELLLINMLAQSAALMQGKKDLENNANSCKGNRPSTVFLLEELTPRSLGQLLAIYEHMVFVQSVIWNINCFDQPGVELGKSIAKEIQLHHNKGTLDEMSLDNSTLELLKKILND